MSKTIDVALKSAEKHYEREISSRFSARMKLNGGDVGNPNSLRYMILSRVAAENYDKAIAELREYVESKHEYPEFMDRSERYVSYSIDLINAVKAKRSFPGLQYLAMGKQQELFDRAMEHFEDLKFSLRKIESIEREVRLEDIRSTVWVLKTVMLCAIVLVLVGVVREIFHGVAPSVGVLLDDLSARFVNWFFEFFGLTRL
jgi:hypothetical protein